MTIIGFQRGIDGESHLLVFDPASRNSDVLTRLPQPLKAIGWPSKSKILESYYRGVAELRGFNEFELL